jgi:hypothetical protein
MMNTLFLREHNRLCQMLEAAHPHWDDERVFQTARNINIVQLIKIVVEEYINHIASAWLRFRLDPTICYQCRLEPSKPDPNRIQSSIPVAQPCAGNRQLERRSCTNGVVPLRPHKIVARWARMWL